MSSEVYFKLCTFRTYCHTCNGFEKQNVTFIWESGSLCKWEVLLKWSQVETLQLKGKSAKWQFLHSNTQPMETAKQSKLLKENNFYVLSILVVNGLLLSEHRWWCLLDSEILYSLSATCYVAFIPDNFPVIAGSKVFSDPQLPMDWNSLLYQNSSVHSSITTWSSCSSLNLCFLCPSTSCILSIQERVPRQSFWFFVLSILLTYESSLLLSLVLCDASAFYLCPDYLTQPLTKPSLTLTMLAVSPAPPPPDNIFSLSFQIQWKKSTKIYEATSLCSLSFLPILIKIRLCSLIKKYNVMFYIGYNAIYVFVIANTTGQCGTQYLQWQCAFQTKPGWS